MTPSFNLTLPRERQPEPEGRIVPDDLYVMLLAWHGSDTQRAVALEIAEANRINAKERK